MTTFHERNGNERRLLQLTNKNDGRIIYATIEFSGDTQHATAFLVKHVHRRLLDDAPGAQEARVELLDLYKKGRMTLAVIDPAIEDSGVGVKILDYNRFNVNIASVDMHRAARDNAMSADAIFGASMKKLVYVKPDPHVVALAEKVRVSHDPCAMTATVLDDDTYRLIEKSFARVPIRKRHAWAYPLDDDKYGTSFIRWTDGAFYDHTAHGKQKVERLSDMPRTGKITSARGESWMHTAKSFFW